MKKLAHNVAFLALLSLLLAACSPSVSPAVSTPTTAPAATNAQPAAADPTVTAAPTFTPQAGKVLLVGPEAVLSDGDANSFQSALAELSQQAGLVLEAHATLQPADLSAAVKVVVLVETPANLSELLAAAPQAQFIVYSGADLTQAANLSVVRRRVENQAFLAGFISVLLSTDYRAAGLLPSDGPLGAGLKDAFVNGGHYFCGVCAPGWPLNIYYPVVAELPASSDGAAWQQAAAGLYDTQKAEVYYIAPESLRPELITFLEGRTQFDKTVLLVGGQTPPQALRSQWAAAVGFDDIAALRQLWPDPLSGKGGAVLDAPLLLTYVNPDLLGEGRLRLVRGLMDEIKSGRIYPFTVSPQ